MKASEFISVKEALDPNETHGWILPNGKVVYFAKEYHLNYLKLIQWPDATTIDMDEMQTETWADLVPGKPVSPLIHQVILRDATVNNKQMLYDTIPKEYSR